MINNQNLLGRHTNPIAKFDPMFFFIRLELQMVFFKRNLPNNTGIRNYFIYAYVYGNTGANLRQIIKISF